MNGNDDPTKQTAATRRWNIVHLIKWIILILLLLLLLAEIGSGEFSQIQEKGFLPWLILIIKLILIAIVLWLMRLQRHVFCEITEPKNCATLEYDAATDSAVVVVRGTASGSVFSSYTLALELSGTPQAITIDYPGGGASGVVAVVNGELGRMHVDTLEPTTGYKVILTVHGAGGATSTCTSLFDLQEKIVYVEKIGKVLAQVVGAHPSDPTEPLRLAKDTPGAPTLPADPENSVGGTISIEGGADVFGCDRQMNEWALQYQVVAFGSDPHQADGAGPWTDIKVLPIFNTDAVHPRRYSFLGINFLPNFVINGDLTRRWATRQILQTLFPPTFQPRRVTESEDWATAAAAALNGRYTVRLRVKHDVMLGGGPIEELYDAVTAWIDNRQILGQITGLAIAGGAALDACDELKLSQFVVGGSKVSMNITGRAWDPIILDSYLPHTDAPNDNFGHYNLTFKKDGGATYVNIVTNQTTPVPPDRQVALPAAPGDVGTLAGWDIVGALDAGPPAGPPAPYPKIYRGDRCAYLIRLYVTDTTHVSDKGDTHDIDFYWPFCIENDLSPSAPFPIP